MTDTPDLAALLDLASEPALALRRAGPGRPAPTVLHLNRALLELAGLSGERTVGRSVRVLRRHFKPAAALEALIQAAESGEPLQTAVEVGDSQGRPVPLALRGRPLPESTDLYLVWLSPRPVESHRGAAAGDRTRPLAGLTHEYVYELAVDVDCRLRLGWVDPRIGELTGHTQEELIQLGGFFTLVLEADRAELQRRNQRLLAGQQVVARYRLRRKDGSIRCVRDTARPEWAPDGEAVTSVAGALLDLSAERADAPLMAMVERQAQLVATTLDAFVCLIDTQGNIRWAGGRGRSALGERLAQNVGRSLGSFLPGAELAFWLDWLEEAAESSQPSRFRFRAPEPSGEREIEAVVSAVGEDVVQLVLHDPPDRRSPSGPTIAPADLLDSLPEPLLLLEPDRRILAMNSAFERLTGQTRAELAGGTLEQLVAPAQHAMLAEVLTLALERKEPASAPGITCLARGGERTLELRLSPVLGPGDAVTAVLVEAQRPTHGVVLPPAPGQGDAWFDAVIESVSDGIITLDAEATVVWLSRSAEVIFDYPGEARSAPRWACSSPRQPAIPRC